MIRLKLPLCIIGMWGIIALMSPVLSLTPNTIDLTHILVGPDHIQWLGFDELGRPIADRLMTGARTSFFVSISVVALGIIIGGIQIGRAHV